MDTLGIIQEAIYSNGYQQRKETCFPVKPMAGAADMTYHTFKHHISSLPSQEC